MTIFCFKSEEVVHEVLDLNTGEGVASVDAPEHHVGDLVPAVASGLDPGSEIGFVVHGSQEQLFVSIDGGVAHGIPESQHERVTRELLDEILVYVDISRIGSDAVIPADLHGQSHGIGGQRLICVVGKQHRRRHNAHHLRRRGRKVKDLVYRGLIVRLDLDDSPSGVIERGDRVLSVV